MKLKLFQNRVLPAAFLLALLIPGPAAGFAPQVQTQALSPAPTITVYRSAGRDSRIVLPVVPAKADKKPN